jgi:hypothetical protein
MATGTPKAIGFLMASQRPLDEWYLNEAAPWADKTTALAGIPSGSRSQYQMVNIAGVLYWFNSSLTDLVVVPTTGTVNAGDVAYDDPGSLYTATEVESALTEVMTAHNALQAEVTGFGTGVNQTVFTILLGAYSTVAARVAGTVTKPTGWTLAASSTVNLLVTHTLTGRKLAGCNIFEIDGSNERLLAPFSSAYTGILCNGLTVLIEGLAPTTLAIRIELLFD